MIKRVVAILLNNFPKHQFYLLLTSLVLLFLPYIIGYTSSWQVSQSYTVTDFGLYLITETGSAPIYALMTSLFLLGLLLVCCAYRSWKIILISVLLVQGAGQVVKIVLKNLTQTPRPYMVALVDSAVDVTSFYQVSRAERANRVQAALTENRTIPNWLKQHWQHETGYSFPSGHTAFAVGWLLLFVGFLNVYPQKNKNISIIVLAGLGLWTATMMLSRVRLGMHFPIDLLVSTMMMYIISALSFYGLLRCGLLGRLKQAI